MHMGRKARRKGRRDGETEGGSERAREGGGWRVWVWWGWLHTYTREERKMREREGREKWGKGEARWKERAQGGERRSERGIQREGGVMRARHDVTEKDACLKEGWGGGGHG